MKFLDSGCQLAQLIMPIAHLNDMQGKLHLANTSWSSFVFRNANVGH